jgi:hypothetical protein
METNVSIFTYDSTTTTIVKPYCARVTIQVLGGKGHRSAFEGPLESRQEGLTLLPD